MSVPSSLTSIAERKSLKGSQFPTSNSINRSSSNRIITPSKPNPSKIQESPRKNLNDNEINDQLIKQLKQLNDLLTLVKPQLIQIEKKNNEQTLLEDLFALEEKIKRKDQQLTAINQENRNLKKVNSTKAIKQAQYSQYESYDMKDQKKKVFILAQQLKNQKQALCIIKDTHQQKLTKLIVIQNQLNKIEHQYLDRCKKTKQKAVTYEMFKTLNEEKKKQLSNKVKKQSQKLKRKQSIKDSIQFNSSPKKALKDKNLQQVMDRRQIAYKAQASKRTKFDQQINEFQAKIQFLRDEQSNLNQTLRQKQLQYEVLILKFKQSQKIRLGDNKFAKIQIGIKYKAQNDYMLQTRRPKRQLNQFSKAH